MFGVFLFSLCVLGFGLALVFMFFVLVWFWCCVFWFGFCGVCFCLLAFVPLLLFGLWIEPFRFRYLALLFYLRFLF